MGYSTPLGWIAIAIGGISSALWGAIISIKYRNTGFKTVICDFFRIKQSPLNYAWMILFLCLDFLPVVTGGNQYVGYFSKVVIIVIAIMLATNTIRKLKQYIGLFIHSRIHNGR